MKYFFAVLLALLFAGCTKKTTIDFSGTAAGINDGQFQIKDPSNDTILCQTPIKAEKFAANYEIKTPGYYNMVITKNDQGSQLFDVYLEPGEYTITVDAQRLYRYPAIQSSSKTQNELTDYYHLQENVNDGLFKKAEALNNELKDPKAKLLSPAAYAGLAARLKEADLQASHSGGIILTEFVAQYPDSKIAPHMMAHINIQEDTATYNKVYQKLSPAVKKSAQGQFIRYLLDHPSKTE